MNGVVSSPRVTRTGSAGAPRTRTDRVVGLDVARSLAVFGMFGAHVGAIAGDVDESPSTWLGVVNGRSSILFAVLAGVSLALLSGRTVPPGGDALVRARTRIQVRAAWVFVIGLALEALGTDVDVILGVYAVLFLLALPFLRWSPARLAAAAAVLAVLSPVVDLLLSRWAAAGDSGDTLLMSLVVTGPYPAVIWWTFLLVGLAVGRSDLTAPPVRAALLGIGASLAVLGYSGGWLSTRWWAGGRPVGALAEVGVGAQRVDPLRLTGAAPHSGTTFEIVGSVGVALAVIAVCLVLADRLPSATSPLAAVGSMALTVYTAQIVAIWALDDGRYGTNGPWAGYVLVSIVVATGWKRTLGRGPLERLLTWSSGRVAARVGRRPDLPHASTRPGGGLARGGGDDAPVAHPGPQESSMTAHTDGTLPTGQYWQAWTVPGPDGVVVLVHGLHEHAGRYAHVADRLAGGGYATYALDHPGHGRSGGTRGDIGSMAAAVGGVGALVRLAAERHPGVPLFVYGHSLGGLIALQYLTGSPDARVRGAVISAPALDTSAATPVQRRVAPVLSRLAPRLGVLALDAETISRDPAVVRDYRTDPLNHNGKVRARTGAEMMLAAAAMPERLRSLTLPLFVLHGSADRLQPPSASEVVATHAGSPDLTRKVYDGLYHEPHNEPEKDQVLDDVVAWLDAHRG